jgi:hypothetical protein
MLIIKDVHIYNSNKSFVDGKYYFRLESNSVLFVLDTHYTFNKNKFFESHTYYKTLTNVVNGRRDFIKNRVVESESQKRKFIIKYGAFRCLSLNSQKNS